MRRKRPCITNHILNIIPYTNIIDKTLQNPPISEDKIKLIPSDNIFTCQYCEKSFTRKDNLKRHIDAKRCKKSCKIINNLIDISDNKYKLLYEKHIQTEQELNDLKKILLPLKNNIKNSTQNIHNNTQNNNTQNNIVINNYIVNHGNEDIKKLTLDENKQILNSNSEAIYNIVKHIHYNPRLPEYNNVYINNLRSNSVYVMSEGKFILEDKKTIISEMISRMAQNIENISNQTMPISKKQKRLLYDNFNWLKHFDLNDEDFDGNIIKSDKDLIDKYPSIISS